MVDAELDKLVEQGILTPVQFSEMGSTYSASIEK